MKTYLLATLIAASSTLAPATARAAVVVTFAGATYAPTGGGPGGSYVRTFDGTDSVYAASATAQSVSGAITIDTVAAGVNGGTASSPYYDGNGGSFLSVSFTSTGATPLRLTGVNTAQTLGSDGGVTFDLFDDAGTYAYTLALFALSPIAAADFGGVALPDFANAGALFFSVRSRQGGNDAFVETVSEGNVTTVSQALDVAVAVPEPASWAMLIAGFGIVGATARRRRVAVPAAA